MKMLIWGWMGIACACAVSAQNLVKNPGFEEKDAKGKTVAWHDSQPTYRFADGIGRNGSRGLAFENKDPKLYILISQNIPAKPGCCYSYSVWAKTEKLTGIGDGARICMEWADAKGKWIGGAYSNLSVSDTKGEWRLIQGGTDAIPTNAASVTVTLFGDRNTIGKIWFDDVTVERYFPPTVTAMVLSGYRGVVTGEVLRAHASLKLRESGIQEGEAEGNFAVIAPDGKVVKQAKSDSMTVSEALWHMDTAPLANGEYKVRFSVVEKMTGKIRGEASTRLCRMARQPARKETIDTHNRLLVNGQPFFPLGMYWSRINQQDMDVFTKGPFNCIMAYSSPTSNELDICQAGNIKVIYSIKDIFAGSTWARVKTVAEEEQLIRKFVLGHKDHPAVLGWYLNDELPLIPFRPQLEAHQRLVESLDPDHPTWVVLYQDPDGYQQTFDAIGIDHYPVPSEPCGNMVKKTRLIAKRTFGERPIWMVPQAMDWCVYREETGKNESRFPNLLEMRSMAWQCIAGGANGIVFYAFFDLKRQKSHEPFEVTWPRTCAVGEEIRRYIPAMLSIEPVPEITHNGPESLAVRAWRLKDELYVLAVNTDNEPRTATLTFSEDIGTDAKADFGPQPQRLDARHLSCTWPALIPAMFRIK